MRTKAQIRKELEKSLRAVGRVNPEVQRIIQEAKDNKNEEAA